jgi:hypothetical protein
MSSLAALVGITTTASALPRKKPFNVILGPGVPWKATAGDPGAERLFVYRNFNPEASLDEIIAGERLTLVKSYDADTGVIISYKQAADTVTGTIEEFTIQDNWAAVRTAKPENAWLDLAKLYTDLGFDKLNASALATVPPAV